MILENAGPKIGLKDIDAVEMALGAQLTPTYRDFLLEFNGGAPTPDTIDIPSAPESPTDVQVFFGIGRSVQSSDLFWNLSLIANRCPGRHVLPIACDSGGNLFCLDVKRGITTEVMYCNLESVECTFYPVVSSFDSFLRQLRSYGQ